MRPIIFPAVALLVALVATGCGSTVAFGGANVASAAAATAAKTFRVTAVVTMRGPGMSLTLTATGAFDYAHSRGVLRMGAGTGLATEERFVPPQVYLKPGGGDQGPLPGGKSWVSMPFAAAGDDAMPFAPFPGGPPSNPVNMLSSLFGVANRVSRMGMTTIRGAEVTHYRVTIDLARAAARIRPGARGEFTAFVRAIAVKTLRADVWVDANGLVRRITIVLPVPAIPGPPALTRVTQTVDFYDFGVPVRVVAPPAGEVASMSQLPKSGVIVGGPGEPKPPPASGTLSPAQAAGAERAVRAFLSALVKADVKTAAQAVVPAQRNCFVSSMNGAPTLVVTELRIVALRAAGPAGATVLFKMSARVKAADTVSPVLPLGPGGVDWLAATAVGGKWYVDLSKGADGLPLIPPCP